MQMNEFHRFSFTFRNGIMKLTWWSRYWGHGLHTQITWNRRLRDLIILYENPTTTLTLHIHHRMFTFTVFMHFCNSHVSCLVHKTRTLCEFMVHALTSFKLKQEHPFFKPTHSLSVCWTHSATWCLPEIWKICMYMKFTLSRCNLRSPLHSDFNILYVLTKVSSSFAESANTMNTTCCRQVGYLLMHTLFPKRSQNTLRTNVLS